MRHDRQPALLEVDAVHTYYGDSHILHGVSLRIAEGEAVGLLGRNGAGKTTTIRSIMSFTPPRAGSVRFRGAEIAGLPPHRVARLGIGLVPQGRRIFPDLTVRENLLLAARDGSRGWTLARAFERFPRLAERQRQLGGTLSGGEQQQLAIARALLLNPTLLLLDEPSEGLAPLLVQEIAQIVRELKAERLSFLLVEQNLHLALDTVDRVYIMNKGQIVFEGTPAALAADEQAHRQYLGV
jgi:branched-chain amino acid transport system ATP-binding protein